MLIYYAIYVLILILEILSKYNKWIKNIGVILIAFLLIFISGFRDVSICRDYKNYEILFQNALDFNVYIQNMALYSLQYEPSAYFVSLFWRSLSFSTNIVVVLSFISFALLGVTIKLRSFIQLTPFFYSAILSYFCYYFMLHEMTQIRAGVAIGICYLSIPYIIQRKLLFFICYIVVATTFHYSSLLFLVAYLLDPFKIDTRKWSLVTFMAMIFALIINNSNITQITGNLFDGMIGLSKLSLHEEIDTEELAPLFSSKFMINALLGVPFFVGVNKISKYSIYVILIVKLYWLSVILYLLCFVIPSAAYRISDVFCSLQPVLISYSFFFFKRKLMPRLIIAIISLFFLFHILYNIAIIKEYQITTLL